MKKKEGDLYMDDIITVMHETLDITKADLYTVFISGIMIGGFFSDAFYYIWQFIKKHITKDKSSQS